MAKLRHVRPGEPISAALFNALVDAVQKLEMLNVAAPLEIKTYSNGQRIISLNALDLICVCELTATLSEGGSATAKVLWDDAHAGTWAIDADTATITVYAPTNMSGASGDRVIAKFDRQSGLWLALQKDC